MQPGQTATHVDRGLTTLSPSLFLLCARPPVCVWSGTQSVALANFFAQAIITIGDEKHKCTLCQKVRHERRTGRGHTRRDETEAEEAAATRRQTPAAAARRYVLACALVDPIFLLLTRLACPRLPVCP